jgi:hypothetical protein
MPHRVLACLIFMLGSVPVGCASVPSVQPAAQPVSAVVPASAAMPPAPAPLAVAAPAVVKLTYRTACDRLNLAGGGSLPSCHTATLVIASPHPRGLPGMAEATLVLRPDGAATPAAPSWWQWMTGANLAAPPVPSEASKLDVPQWQVEAIVGKLRAANFFQRSRVLTADAFLAAEVGPEKLAKDCRPVPELDALVLRARLAQTPQGPALALPSTQLASPLPVWDVTVGNAHAVAH